MMFDHSDCACKNAHDTREISEMKKQLGEFLSKWENFFKQQPPDLTSPDLILKIDNLQRQTADQLNREEPEADIKVGDVVEKIAEEQPLKEDVSGKGAEKKDAMNKNASKESTEKKRNIPKDEDKKKGSNETIINQDGIKEKTIEEASTKNIDQKSDMKDIGGIKMVDSKVNNSSDVQDLETEKQASLQKKNKKENANKKGMYQYKPAKKENSKTEKITEARQLPDAPMSREPADVNQKTTTPHHGNAVAEQCVWNVAHVSGKPTQPKLQYSQAAASGVVKPVEKVSSLPKEFQHKPTVIEQKLEDPEPADVKKTTASPALPITQAQSVEPSVEKMITVACAENENDVPMTIFTDISPAITESSRSAGTPDSGMISDISEVKPAEPEANSAKKETPKSKDPEKLTGRDARRYRQKLREAGEIALALVVNKDVVADVRESKKDSVESEVPEAENASPTGKERRRQKDKLRKEKKEQEKLLQQSEPAEADSGVSETDAVNTPEKPDGIPVASEEAARKPDVQPYEPIAAVEEVANNQLVKDEAVEETPEEVAPDNDNVQVKKWSKGQRRRAQKKAAKAVYEVNGDGSHSLELLPGQYKLVQLDKDKNIQEIEFVNGVERKVREGKRGRRRRNGAVVRPMNKSIQELLAAGKISKDLLDNGKWLAYVVDDKNPNGAPKLGEVSTADVAKTIEMLDSQAAVKRALIQDGYIDDVDYSCPKATGLISTTISQIVPEFNADSIRDSFGRLIECGEPECYTGPTKEEIATQPPVDDLQLMIEQEPGFKLHTELAKRTAPLLVGNDEFREFCIKYSKSKYDNGVISRLIKKYIDRRIVFHFARFKKLADRESRRIAQSWSKVSDSSPFALMLMLYINSPTSNVAFDDIEAVLFPTL